MWVLAMHSSWRRVLLLPSGCGGCTASSTAISATLSCTQAGGMLKKNLGNQQLRFRL